MKRITDHEPQPGFYKRRFVRGGPWVPVRIWWHEAARDESGDLLEDEDFRCEVSGEPANAYDQWVKLMPVPAEIDETEYNYLLRLGGWAREHAPADPYADPKRSIDLNQAPTLF